MPPVPRKTPTAVQHFIFPRWNIVQIWALSSYKSSTNLPLFGAFRQNRKFNTVNLQGERKVERSETGRKKCFQAISPGLWPHCHQELPTLALKGNTEQDGQTGMDRPYTCNKLLIHHWSGHQTTASTEAVFLLQWTVIKCNISITKA